MRVKDNQILNEKFFPKFSSSRSMCLLSDSDTIAAISFNGLLILDSYTLQEISHQLQHEKIESLCEYKKNILILDGKLYDIELQQYVFDIGISDVRKVCRATENLYCAHTYQMELYILRLASFKHQMSGKKNYDCQSIVLKAYERIVQLKEVEKDIKNKTLRLNVEVYAAGYQLDTKLALKM